MYRLSCPTTWGIFPDQWSNQCPLPWQADSQPLDHQGSPVVCFSYLWHFFLKIFNHAILSSRISSDQWNPLGWQECLFLHCLIQWPLSLNGYWAFEIWLVKLKFFSSSSFSAIRVVSSAYLRLLIFLLLKKFIIAIVNQYLCNAYYVMDILSSTLQICLK